MTAADPTYCARCGEDLTGGHTGRAGETLETQHAECSRALLLEPPRYCPRCRRRMVVQVTPVGWSATCVQHGTTTSAAADSSLAR
jgi:hypothetical protein